MTDATSPIYDFYPEEFEEDLNGKKNEWEAVVKIPFIDEERLLAAMKSMFLCMTTILLMLLMLPIDLSSRKPVIPRGKTAQLLWLDVSV
jgi:hypothetical protein